MRSLLRKGLTVFGIAALLAIPLGFYPRFFGRKRLRFTYLTRLLGAMLGAGDWSSAETALERLLPYIGEVGSARTAGLLHGAARYIGASDAPSRLQEASRNLESVLTAAGYAG